MPDRDIKRRQTLLLGWDSEVLKLSFRDNLVHLDDVCMALQHATADLLRCLSFLEYDPG